MIYETHDHPVSYVCSTSGFNLKTNNNNTTVEHVATVSPFEFFFSNFPIGQHSLIKVYTCLQYRNYTGILHVLIHLLLPPTMTLFRGRQSEDAVNMAVSYSEYCPNWFNIEILFSM